MFGAGKFLGSAIAVAAFASTALTGIEDVHAQAKPFEGVTLRVATFGGPWRDDQVKYIAPKLEAMGAKVEYVIGSPQDNLAKLIAARGREAPFDVFEILDAQFDTVLEGGFLAPVDYNIVKNSQFLEPWQRHPNAIANWTTQEVICYDKGKFAELGIPAPTTYKDLAHEKLAGRVMIPDITSGGGLANFAGIAYAAGGDVNNVKPGLELIRSLKALKFWKAGGDVVTAFKSGDIYAAIAHAGWCLRAIKTVGANVTSVHPRINAEKTGVIKLGWMGVVKGSKNAAAAMHYLNGFVDEEFQVAFAKTSGVWPVNRPAIQRLRTEDPVFVALNKIEKADTDRMLRIDYKGVNVNSWYDQWNRSVSR